MICEKAEMILDMHLRSNERVVLLYFDFFVIIQIIVIFFFHFMVGSNQSRRFGNRFSTGN